MPNPGSASPATTAEICSISKEELQDAQRNHLWQMFNRELGTLCAKCGLHINKHRSNNPANPPANTSSTSSGAEAKPTAKKEPPAHTRTPEYIEAQRKLRLKTAFLDAVKPHPFTNSVEALAAAGIKLAIPPRNTVPPSESNARKQFLCHDVLNYIFQFVAPMGHLARIARVSRDWYFASVTILAPVSGLKRCFPRPQKPLHSVNYKTDEFIFHSNTVFGAKPTFIRFAVASDCEDNDSYYQVAIGPFVFYFSEDRGRDWGGDTFRVSEYRSAKEAVAANLPQGPGAAPASKSKELYVLQTEFGRIGSYKAEKEFPTTPQTYLQAMKDLVSELGVSLTQLASCLPSEMRSAFTESLVDASERLLAPVSATVSKTTPKK